MARWALLFTLCYTPSIAYHRMLMLRRYRHRRGPYTVATPSRTGKLVKKLIWYIIFLLLLYWMGAWVVGLFGGGRSMQSRTVEVTTQGGVTVSFDGGLLQPAETGVKLHPGDRIVTVGGIATLNFFDGSRVRLDEESDVLIRESEEGSESATYDIQMSKGALWIRTPTIVAYSGSMIRTVQTTGFTVDVPSDAEVVIEQDGMIVFSADGQGVVMQLAAGGDPIVIGEGQQIQFPDTSAIAGDPLRFRSAINPLAIQRAFIEDARKLSTGTAYTGDAEGTGEVSDLLNVRSPEQNAVVSGRTVFIDGSVDSRVDRVRVNGYLATIDRTSGTFQQELALREGETTMSIHIEALDARGLSLAETTRTVQSSSDDVANTEPDASQPVITEPATTGQVYRTQKSEIVIRGTAPAGTEAMEVNDYRLQLFTPGNPTWSYLATTTLNNLVSGRNVYNVYAIDAEGTRSTAATITILLEAGTEGVVTAEETTGTPPPVQMREEDLPKNDPLLPGSISITSPAPGATYTATGTGFLLEGATSDKTDSIWVNGYRLQLYTPGATFWNYIASVDLGTLKPGTNEYRIVARDGQNQILDTFTYTVQYVGEEN